MSRSARVGLVLAGVIACVGSAMAGASAAPARRHPVSVVPAWARHATSARPMVTSTPMRVKVWLAPRDPDRLQALAAAVSDPTNAAFRHYLTAAQYAQRFAPSPQAVAAVSHWATASGLSVAETGPGNHYLTVTGSASAVSRAFTANLKDLSVAGRRGVAPTSTITVPASLGSSVLAVTGLNTVTTRATPANSGKDAPSVSASPKASLDPPVGYVNSSTCSRTYGQKVDWVDPLFSGKRLPYSICGYTPAQFRSAYGVSASRRTGANQTIAIVDAFASPTIEHDANTYATAHGDQPFAHGQLIQRNAMNYDPQRVQDCGGNSWFGEETLDVEAAHGMAPKAAIAYYGAASCYDDDLLAALSRIVTDNTASIVSNSWGQPSYLVQDGVTYTTLDPAVIEAYQTIFEQGAVQGIGFFFSSGDDGDELANTGVAAPDYPAADPWVTAVGGTALAITRMGRRLFETGWGTNRWALAGGAWTPTGFVYGAGAGCSDVFDRPAYQGAATGGCAMRSVADVAMDADPTTGMLIGQTQTFTLASVWGPAGVHYGEFRIGGTSLAAPLFAGLQADAQQLGPRLGFANPVIYRLAARTHAFYDVRPQGHLGNVRVDYVNGANAASGSVATVRTFNQDSSLSTGAGYDPVSGVGAPTSLYILNADR